jgi:hypothetical protein
VTWLQYVTTVVAEAARVAGVRHRQCVGRTLQAVLVLPAPVVAVVQCTRCLQLHVIVSLFRLISEAGDGGLGHFVTSAQPCAVLKQR